jgi:flavodoxin
VKALIIYTSKHQGNTETIARATATALQAEFVKLSEPELPPLANYDLIGFGSGIYWGKHDKEILTLVRSLPPQRGKHAFIFSTSGRAEGRVFNRYNRRLERALTEKGFVLVGEFSCRGHDAMGPLKLLGGFNRGRPNEADLEAAARFVREVVERAKHVA